LTTGSARVSVDDTEGGVSSGGAVITTGADSRTLKTGVATTGVSRFRRGFLTFFSGAGLGFVTGVNSGGGLGCGLSSAMSGCTFGSVGNSMSAPNSTAK